MERLLTRLKGVGKRGHSPKTSAGRRGAVCANENGRHKTRTTAPRARWRLRDLRMAIITRPGAISPVLFRKDSFTLTSLAAALSSPPDSQRGELMSFQCTLVTPEQQVLDETVTQAIVPAHDGSGRHPDRALPPAGEAGTGELRIDLPGGQQRFFFVDGGVAQMKDNKLTILSTDAAAGVGDRRRDRAGRVRRGRGASADRCEDGGGAGASVCGRGRSRRSRGSDRFSYFNWIGPLGKPSG